MMDRIERWVQKVLGARISPAYYVIAASSLVVGLFAIFTFIPYYELTGVALIVGAIMTLMGFRSENKDTLEVGALVSFMGWVFIGIYLTLSGALAAIALLAIPYTLYFAYFYLGRGHPKFWR